MRELLIAMGLLTAPFGLWLVAGDGIGTSGDISEAAPMPVLSDTAGLGQVEFAQACGGCHGARAEGTDRGPPLVHADYAPGLRSDQDIRHAVRNGVSAWRWSYGDMPAITGVAERDLDTMIRFLREMQRANGIG